MLTIRLRTVVLLTCLLEAMWLLVAQAFGSVFLILPCLACFLLLVVWATIKGMALPVLMFFLPFSTLLKTSPGEKSFFTIALLVVYIISLVLGHRKIGVVHAIPAGILAGLCLFVKTLYNYNLDSSFVLFVFSLMVVPFVAIEFGKKYDFYWLTLFFAVGIVFAAISSMYLVQFPSIARYIERLELFGVVRRSGYYGDPNFYSAHISAAISGVLVLVANNTSRARTVSLTVMLVALAYCGLLAVSKMFSVILICLSLFFILEILFKRGRMSAKALLLLTFLVAVVFLVSMATSSQLIEMILSRFGASSNLSDFTTGRTDVWIEYFRAFKEDTLLLLLGRGYTKVLVATKASHNTFIQQIFQFGLVGCVIFAGWIVCLLRILLKNVKIKRNHFAMVCILLAGAIGPWMALDILFGDELFLMPMYVGVGLAYIANKNGIPLFADNNKTRHFGYGRKLTKI